MWLGAALSPLALDDLGALFGGEELEKVLLDIKNNHWLLVTATLSGEHVGSMVVAIDADGIGLVLHCKALSGRSCGQDVVASAFTALREAAKSGCCYKITCQTEREGMRRRCEKLGAKTRYLLELDIET